MKNLIIYSGISLVVLTNLNSPAFGTYKEVETSKKTRIELLVNKGFYAKSKKNLTSKSETIFHLKTVFLRNFTTVIENKTCRGDEPIEVISVHKMNKTADQLIAEDNEITGNNISNETRALDYYLINSISEAIEEVEPVRIPIQERTADQLIAEDNTITGNKISNATLALNYNLINSISEVFAFVESINISKKEKNADQLIAEDNAITGNSISNETQELDFAIINKCSKS